MLVEQGGPFLRGLRRQGKFYFSLQLKSAFLAVLAVDVAWVRDQIRAVQQSAKRLELFLLVGRNINQAGAGLESARRTGGHVLVAHWFRRGAGNEPVRYSPPHGDERGFQHRDIDEFALIVALLSKKGGCDGKSRGEASYGIRYRITDPKRRRLFVARHTH